MTTFEVRNAIFVSPFGSDANPGSVTSPKLTIGAGATYRRRAGPAAGRGRRRDVRAGGGVAISANVSVLGGFDQARRLDPPGHGRAVGHAGPEPHADLGVRRRASPCAGAVTVTLDALTDRRACNTGLGAGASVYGVRAVGASVGSPANVTINNSKVTAAAGKDGTDSAVGG